jgi:hypothetical protein
MLSFAKLDFVIFRFLIVKLDNGSNTTGRLFSSGRLNDSLGSSPAKIVMSIVLQVLLIRNCLLKALNGHGGGWGVLFFVGIGHTATHGHCHADRRALANRRGGRSWGARLRWRRGQHLLSFSHGLGLFMLGLGLGLGWFRGQTRQGNRATCLRNRRRNVVSELATDILDV